MLSPDGETVDYNIQSLYLFFFIFFSEVSVEIILENKLRQ